MYLLTWLNFKPLLIEILLILVLLFFPLFIHSLFLVLYSIFTKHFLDIVICSYQLLKNTNYFRIGDISGYGPSFEEELQRQDWIISHLKVFFFFFSVVCLFFNVILCLLIFVCRLSGARKGNNFLFCAVVLT